MVDCVITSDYLLTASVNPFEKNPKRIELKILKSVAWLG